MLQVEQRPLDAFVERIRRREPFAFSRWGDSEWHAVFGRTHGRNKDGHAYFPDLNRKLRGILLSRPPYMLGMQNFSLRVFEGKLEQWLSDNGLDDLNWINADVFHKASEKGQLTPLVEAMRQAPALVVVGPPHFARLEDFLGYRTLVQVPPQNAYLAHDALLEEVIGVLDPLPDGSVVSVSASMEANLLIDALSKLPAGQRHLLIDVGSLWDPYAGVRSRTYMQGMDVEAVPSGGKNVVLEASSNGDAEQRRDGIDQQPAAHVPRPGATRRILDQLFRTSPYEGFPVDNYAPDTQGWGSKQPVFDEIIRTLRPTILVEVGTWKGRSAIHMAGLCKKYKLASEIVCVDTWLGEPAFGLASSPWHESLNHRFGYPQLFYTFMRNVIDAGVQEIITPLPLPSDGACFVLKKLGVRADFIYIDGSHQYETVIRDLEMYWDLLAERGVLLGDDYVGGGGVGRAAREFALSVGRSLYAIGNKFVIGRSGDFVPPSGAMLVRPEVGDTVSLPIKIRPWDARIEPLDRWAAWVRAEVHRQADELVDAATRRLWDTAEITPAAEASIDAS